MKVRTMSGNGEALDVPKFADQQAVAAEESPRRGAAILVSHD